jgi:hypothetical protein
MASTSIDKIHYQVAMKRFNKPAIDLIFSLYGGLLMCNGNQWESIDTQFSLFQVPSPQQSERNPADSFDKAAAGVHHPSTIQ